MTKSRLSKEQIQELNTLLADKHLDLPVFRREVLPTGHNFDWLQANIRKRNKALAPRLLELLNIT